MGAPGGTHAALATQKPPCLGYRASLSDRDVPLHLDPRIPILCQGRSCGRWPVAILRTEPPSWAAQHHGLRVQGDDPQGSVRTWLRPHAEGSSPAIPPVGH